MAEVPESFASLSVSALFGTASYLTAGEILWADQLARGSLLLMFYGERPEHDPDLDDTEAYELACTLGGAEQVRLGKWRVVVR